MSGLAWAVWMAGLGPAPAEESCANNLDVEKAALTDPLRRAITSALELEDRATVSNDWERLLFQSRKILEAAARGSKGCTIPHYHLALSYRRTMLYDSAERWLRAAIDGNSRFYEAEVALAEVKMLRKDFDAAVSLSSSALEHCSYYHPAAEAKASALIRLDRFEEAKSVLDSVEIVEAPASGKWKQSIVQLRDKLRRNLKGPDWTPRFVSESENYKVTAGTSQSWADEVAQRAELIRIFYKKIFPEISRPSRKYEIWVYPDGEAYFAADAPKGTGGYYDPLFRTLVMYRMPKVEETFEVLQHEAFHQYLHDYLEIAPTWFDEGLGDYFGAFEYYTKSRRHFVRPRPNTGRLVAIQSALERGRYSSIESLMQMSQAQMYRFAGIHYPQAWSLIYFIVEGENSKASFATSAQRRYYKTLQAYFKLLRAGKNLVQAYERTFGRLDMEKFEGEWKHFILSLDARP